MAGWGGEAMNNQTTIACMLGRHVEVNGKCRGCGMELLPVSTQSDDRISPLSKAWLESLGMYYEAETDMLTWHSDDLTFAIHVWLFESWPEWFICGESLGEQSPNTKHRVMQLFLALGIPVPQVEAPPVEKEKLAFGDIFRQSLSLFWKNQQESSKDE